MKVAIAGYGRMGKMIEKALQAKKIEVGAIIDKFNDEAKYKQIDATSLKDIDVVIDFTVPDGIIDNIKVYNELGVSAVIGTTGWFDRLDEVKEIIGDNIGLIWSGNFSLGVNIFFKMVRHASKIFNKFDVYDPILYELHHNQKKDSPSGTAIMIGDIMLDELDRKKRGATERLDRQIDEDEIHFASIRGGSIPGTHVAMYDSAFDTIELKHTARTREGFAQGAVLAAEWIADKKGFYSINDLMDTII